ncbi:MAG: cytochrome c biogenesis protein ResB [Actinomycetota bacterium]|nr:cytochrome c biogenesis protein ResB [Actinomycetota bacterium]
MATADAFYRALISLLRTLRSMRTALILLLVVAVASVLGSLVPQIGVDRRAVIDVFVEHPLRARIYQALGLFDVYGSLWFTFIYSLLLVSLASCLVPRTRARWRERARRPQAVRELEGMRHFAEGVFPMAPEPALDRARRVLRRRRFRVTAADPGLAAEKGAARESGSLLFHWSLFLILIGAVYGKGFGFSGQATVVEGETWTEAHASYDGPPVEGRFFSEDMHAGFRMRLERFEAAYHPNGIPRHFISEVSLLDEAGRVAESTSLGVNEPLSHQGVKIYQQGYGWAPVIEVRGGGRVLASGPVVFITRTPNDMRRPWQGVIKLPSLRPQVGIQFSLFPDPRAGVTGQPMLHALDPFLSYTVWEGDLRLSSAQSVFELDRAGLRRIDSGGVGIGESAELPGGLTVTFTNILRYSQFLVKRDPGTGIMLLAALLIVAGLIPALSSSRRRVWVRAIPEDGAGTRLQVGGFALQRRAAFEEEFREIAGELVQ